MRMVTALKTVTSLSQGLRLITGQAHRWTVCMHVNASSDGFT